MTTISLMLVTVLALSVPRVIDSYWLAILIDTFSSTCDRFLLVGDTFSSTYDRFLLVGDTFSSTYDRFLLVGDFNAEDSAET